MARPSPSAAQLGYGALVFSGIGAVALAAWRLYRNQEKIMADFSGLDADINALKTEVAAAAARVEAAVGKILDDSADEQEIAEARTEIQEAVAALKAIAPEPAPEPGPVPTEPEQPGEPV